MFIAPLPCDVAVSTRSRPKAAGYQTDTNAPNHFVFQHAAARRRLDLAYTATVAVLCFNTQPPEGGWGVELASESSHHWFQHAAARRRLDLILMNINH